MASVKIIPLATSNTSPTLTGTVDYKRFGDDGQPRENFYVTVNYTKYTPFDGNLGLDETTTPAKWKLHFSTTLYPGIYEVEANVVDIASNSLLATDYNPNGIIINQLTQKEYKQKNPTLLERVATVSLLMASLNKLFGGKNGISPVPSVHPTLNDDASTSLVGRGNEEAAEDTMRKSKDKTQRKGNVKANPVVNKAVDPTASAAGTYTPTELERAAAGDLNVIDNLDFLSAGSMPSDTISTLNEQAAAATTAANAATAAGTSAATTTPSGMAFGGGGL
jgi:ribosomal protein S16